MNTAIRIMAALLGLAASLPSFGGEWDIAGFVGADVRGFWQDSRHAGQDDGLDGSLIVQPAAYWQSSDGRQRLGIVGFARMDSQDAERTHADVREAHWSYEGEGWDAILGINKVFWGVTESRHLIDVINQTDLVEDIDQEDKLGQPMINVNLQRDIGRFEFFLLPYFRERTFPGPDGRLRPSLPVDTDNAIFESEDAQQHLDYAIRYSHYLGDADIGVYAFDGTSREPQFVLAETGDRVFPFYEQMTQVGVELQYTREAWLWKLEAIGRDTRDDSFVAMVGGFEYTFYGVRNSAADIGVLVEILYDGRGPNAPPTVFDNDVFFGSRLAFNDAQDTSILAGFAVDSDTRELFLNVEAERRFGDSLSAELRIRAFANSSPGDSLYGFERDDYAQIRLSWYY